MADDIIDQLKDLASTLKRGEGQSTVYGAINEINRLRELVVSFGKAHHNRKHNIGGGVETWNALNRATDTMLVESSRITEDSANA